MGPRPPCYSTQDISASCLDSARKVYGTHSKEQPLEHLAVLLRLTLGRERDLVFSVIVLGEVQQDRGRLKDGEVVAGLVDEDGDAAVGVELDEPRFLLDIS